MSLMDENDDEHGRIFEITQCLDFMNLDEKSEICSYEDTISEQKLLTPVSDSDRSINYNIPFLNEFIELPINDKILGMIFFRESLIISCYDKENDENNKIISKSSLELDDVMIHDVGGFSLNIEKGASNIIIYNTSQFSCNGKGVTSSILSVVDQNLNFIEEKITETICVPESKMEKSIHLISENEKIIAFRTEVDGNNIQKFRGNINLKVTGNLIPDGLNFLLLRYLVLSQFTGKIDTWSIDVTGQLSRTVYCVGHAHPKFVNGLQKNVTRIIRTIYRRDQQSEEITCYFLSSGHLIRISWNHCDYIIRLNPLSTIPPNEIISNLQNNWRDDIQLLSDYLDMKEQRQSEIKTYLNDKPEVKCLIKDYIMILLQIKPEDVLNFTIEYFIQMMEKTMVNDDDEDDAE